MNRILIVDDSDLVSGVLTQFLEENGYEIERACNGVEGIEKAYNMIPDLIIMDVEMPIMQGYQASRLLKSRRWVKDIPILMHTSLSDDRDKYWAISCGADDFVTKDFDNLDLLLEKVRTLLDHPQYSVDAIKEEASTLTRDRIFEMIGLTLDVQLFNSTINNLLGEISHSSMRSLQDTIREIIFLLNKVCESHICILMLEYKKRPYSYARVNENVFRSDLEDFQQICLNDFYESFQGLNLEDVEKTIFSIDTRDDFEKERIDNKKISSYSCFNLMGKGGKVVGTLHLGNFSNNYYSDYITGNIRIFADGAGMVVENSLLYKEVLEMKDKIRHVFSKFVPEEIINDLVEKESDKDLMVGEKRNIVVLFSDIRAFTTISETNTPEQVVSFLNRYFDTQVAIIKKYGGNIDKFIGDAIFAIFGAPISYEDNAVRAAKASIEMIEALPTITTDGMNIPEPGFRIGIGLHEGDAIVGNIGSSTKFDYTAIGDTVNLAARLESLTKHYKREILVSEEMKDKLKDGFPLREIDFVKVKGKDIATSLFAVEFDSRLIEPEYLKEYKKAYKMYRLGNFTSALEYFTGLHKLIPEDTVVETFIGRCEEFLKTPPENWDGSLTLDFK
ncbi:MAG: adenylate/guanylate cyclase domain-containing response regulator [Spirochaetales bacterium]|nr:adenylate/guanylate cyclase domain-containing response regulator [Spirochaetales bacterium]